MYKVKELQLSTDSFDNPLFRLHLRCFRWYGYVASIEQRHPWLALLRCTIFTASIWLSCALMLLRLFLSRGYESINDGATSWATAVQYFAVSIATLNAYVQRERKWGRALGSLSRICHLGIFLRHLYYVIDLFYASVLSVAHYYFS